MRPPRVRVACAGPWLANHVGGTGPECLVGGGAGAASLTSPWWMILLPVPVPALSDGVTYQTVRSVFGVDKLADPSRMV